MTAITFHTDGHVRIMKWQGREQPYTIWRGDKVWHFASCEAEAMRLAAEAKRSRAA